MSIGWPPPSRICRALQKCLSLPVRRCASTSSALPTTAVHQAAVANVEAAGHEASGFRVVPVDDSQPARVNIRTCSVLVRRRAPGLDSEVPGTQGQEMIKNIPQMAHRVGQSSSVSTQQNELPRDWNSVFARPIKLLSGRECLKVGVFSRTQS